MRYPGRQLVHDKKFDRDCEHFFGSLAQADDLLAGFVFELAHGLAVGAKISPQVTAFMQHGDRPCVVIVELADDQLFLRGLVALDVPAQLAA